MISVGLENLKNAPGVLEGKGRLGLLYNQASVDRSYVSAADIVHGLFPERLTTLFGPQHGIASTEQDNMKESAHARHTRLDLPIWSLYSETRRPTARMLENTDTVLVDIQDVGTRVYTFAWTVTYLMEACAATGRSVVILDRPNPIGGAEVEGNMLLPEFASFVGPYPIPMRHGMTLGELMTMCNTEFGIGCALEVIPMTGWRRDDYFEDTGAPWVMPSPNMPCAATAVVYPGQVCLEGTNLSEGRGSTRPFELFGAPYFDGTLRHHIPERALEGVTLQEFAFAPTFNKWAHRPCAGYFAHVVDRRIFKPYRFTLEMLAAVIRLYPDHFAWAPPPYEYVTDKLPIDVIFGDERVRSGLEAARPVHDMEREWADGLRAFTRVREKYLLY